MFPARRLLPGASLVTAPPCSTHTSPSATATRDPLGAVADAKIVPLTATSHRRRDEQRRSPACLAASTNHAAALRSITVPARAPRRKLGVLVHLDPRAVGEAQQRAGVAAGAGRLFGRRSPRRCGSVPAAYRRRGTAPRRRARPPSAPVLRHQQPVDYPVVGDGAPATTTAAAAAQRFHAASGRARGEPPTSRPTRDCHTPAGSSRSAHVVS